MIVTANRIPVNPEFADAFEARFANRAGLVDNMPGFVANYVLRPATPDTRGRCRRRRARSAARGSP